MAEDTTENAQVVVPPPLLMIVSLAAAFAMNWVQPVPIPIQWLRWLGVLIVLGGLSLAFLAVREFIAAGTTLDPHSQATTLVTSGPYRISRNPIYLGFLLMEVGLPLAGGTPWGLFFAPLLIISYNQLVIRFEEAHLQKRFGLQYREYHSQVRRWL